MPIKNHPEDHPILLFDGVCNLCNRSVQFVIGHDREGFFRFASLQSDFAKQLLEQASPSIQDLRSVVLFDNGRFLTRSDAALRVLYLLGGYWKVFYFLRFIPRPLRDAVYDWIARNRYRWFGKRDSCMVPTPELRGRFLDQGFKTT